jgi:Putative lumazine-binding
MEKDYGALLVIAQTYFDAAYEMDAEKFATIFYAASSVTKVGDDGNVSVAPIETWLAAVRCLKSPKQSGLERRELSDEIVSIDIARDLAVVKLTFRTGARHFTDMLSCLRSNGSWKIAQKVMTVETL